MNFHAFIGSWSIFLHDISLQLCSTRDWTRSANHRRWPRQTYRWSLCLMRLAISNTTTMVSNHLLHTNILHRSDMLGYYNNNWISKNWQNCCTPSNRWVKCCECDRKTLCRESNRLKSHCRCDNIGICHMPHATCHTVFYRPSRLLSINLRRRQCRRQINRYD